MLNKDWSLQKIPPKGNKDVADFAFELFEIARLEKERLQKPEEFMNNYALYRGKTNSKSHGRTPVNLYFANIERTVSNITARAPVGEVVDLDGIGDDSEKVLSMALQKWWKDTKQREKGRHSARSMEIYGITVEKPYYNKELETPDIIVSDPFGFFPAPGNWDDIAVEAPFICYASLDFVGKTEAEFEVKGVAAEEAYELLGGAREKQSASVGGTRESVRHYVDPVTPVLLKDSDATDGKVERCLIIEVWVRDLSTRTITEEKEIFDNAGNPVLDETGELVIEKITTKQPVYPDGIRKITITQAKGDTKKKKTTSAYMVLDDCANPNINPNLKVELAETTHPWGRFPCYYANSYKDLISVWGFSAAEQVGDLVTKINLIVSKLVNYVLNVMSPPLIVQKNCGISRAQIEEQLEKTGRLILMPTIPNARIEFMQIPNLPSTFFNVLDLIVKFFDRIYQIEDADRGQAPNGVIAASAIVALQERNQVMMQSKTSSMDMLAEEKSKWAIGLWQNFGVEPQSVEVNGDQTPYLGVEFAGRHFNYVVEAGSSMPRTTLQLQEMAKWLYEVKAIGQRGLLEAVNWPDWKNEIERTAENQLDQALQILIESGLPEETAIQLREHLMVPGQGPGDAKKSGTGKQRQPTGGA